MSSAGWVRTLLDKRGASVIRQHVTNARMYPAAAQYSMYHTVQYRLQYPRVRVRYAVATLSHRRIRRAASMCRAHLMYESSHDRVDADGRDAVSKNALRLQRLRACERLLHAVNVLTLP